MEVRKPFRQWALGRYWWNHWSSQIREFIAPRARRISCAFSTHFRLLALSWSLTRPQLFIQVRLIEVRRALRQILLLAGLAQLRSAIYGLWKSIGAIWFSVTGKSISAERKKIYLRMIGEILPYSDVERLFRENRQAKGAGFLREKSAGALFRSGDRFAEAGGSGSRLGTAGCCQYFNVWPGPDRSSAGQVAGRAQGLYV